MDVQDDIYLATVKCAAVWGHDKAGNRQLSVGSVPVAKIKVVGFQSGWFSRLLGKRMFRVESSLRIAKKNLGAFKYEDDAERQCLKLATMLVDKLKYH